jgi:hypothetical protein
MQNIKIKYERPELKIAAVFVAGMNGEFIHLLT